MDEDEHQDQRQRHHHIHRHEGVLHNLDDEGRHGDQGVGQEQEPLVAPHPLAVVGHHHDIDHEHQDRDHLGDDEIGAPVVDVLVVHVKIDAGPHGYRREDHLDPRQNGAEIPEGFVGPAFPGVDEGQHVAGEGEHQQSRQQEIQQTAAFDQALGQDAAGAG